MMETASEPFPLSANFSATMEAPPKYAPWGNPDMKRAPIIVQKLGEKAAQVFPIIIRATNPSNIFFSGSLRARVSMGAPAHTPNA